ncbi:MAG: universal stress protein [Nitrospirae bacterium]|nr:universal stress protein [Nitrospirota bacterium]MCL5977925.1 universal stress protein [Nitrospirota bacterium]
MYRNILLSTDGSKLSEEAVKRGVELAKSINAKITGLYVIPKPTPGDIWDVWAPENTEEGKMFRTKFEASFECAAARYISVIENTAKEAGVPCECFYVRGESPSDEIIKAAQDKGCDLIIMASHGRGGIGAFLGSVTTKVLAGSKISVLVHR